MEELENLAKSTFGKIENYHAESMLESTNSVKGWAFSKYFDKRLAAIQTAPDAYKIDGGSISEGEYSALTDDEKIIWRLRTIIGTLNLQKA